MSDDAVDLAHDEGLALGRTQAARVFEVAKAISRSMVWEPGNGWRTFDIPAPLKEELYEAVVEYEVVEALNKGARSA